MTREQAIEVLKLVDENASCDDCLYYAQTEDCPTDEDCIIRQALDMAIKALEIIDSLKDREPHDMVCVGDLVGMMTDEVAEHYKKLGEYYNTLANIRGVIE